MNLPRKLLIWKIQRNEREEGEKERARGEMGRSCTVTEVCWKGKRCREKEKGREKEKNEASDGWYGEWREKNQSGSKNHLKTLKEEACSDTWNLDCMVVKSEPVRKDETGQSTQHSIPCAWAQKGLLNLIMVLHHHQQKDVIMKKARNNLQMKFKKPNSSCSTGRKKCF